MSITHILQSCASFRRFTALDETARSIVFYAEGPGDWPHLGPVIEEVGRQHPVVYLTSDASDPQLTTPPAGVQSFFIGSGLVRTLIFLKLRADVMVMTTPDLEVYQLKRSRVHDVHYAYIFHSPVSTHMVYRPQAFDHFDTVLCAGPHHIPEIRARETRLGLNPKVLLEHGYGRLDRLIHESKGAPDHHRDGVRCLVAPSWGPNGLLENHAVPLCSSLLDAGYDVTVRPHPMTCRLRRDVLTALCTAFDSHSAWHLDLDPNSSASLTTADIMISDWSGAAFDFALGFERPVVFVDVPRKVNNPNYEDLPNTPLEVSHRPALGAVVGFEDLDTLPQVVGQLLDDDDFSARVQLLRPQVVFNVGRSNEVGANHILRLAEQAVARRERRRTTSLAPAGEAGL